MKKYIFISIGGFIGAIARYLFELIQILGYHELFPLNTLIINIAGCFIMAFFITLAFEFREVNPDIRHGVTIGFLGAFTTFATLCKETFELMRIGDYFSAISYITISIMLGLGVAYLGTILARSAGLRLFRRKEKIEIESEVE